MIIVRKNLVVATATFTASDGSGTQASAANLVLNYLDQAGNPHSVTITMSFNATTGEWSGEWDSSAAGNGPVFWMIYCYGPLQAASEGVFQIEANAANTV